MIYKGSVGRSALGGLTDDDAVDANQNLIHGVCLLLFRALGNGASIAHIVFAIYYFCRIIVIYIWLFVDIGYAKRNMPGCFDGASGSENRAVCAARIKIRLIQRSVFFTLELLCFLDTAKSERCDSPHPQPLPASGEGSK